MNQPFDLMNDILLRVTLIKLHEEQHVLLITLHHIASDGWSLGILRRELELLYREYRHGGTPQLAELTRSVYRLCCMAAAFVAGPTPQ